ncbi:MAG: LysR family transcriptional regulator [Rhodospirillales bacterium]|nr:LysR family transcriptional regulator [Rhodospirillales bacterium]
MSHFDQLDLDGHALSLFLAVLEEGSVTAAAMRLGLTQSAVSHGLARLRRIIRDPLFAKSGRGIVATAHAHALAARARVLLDEMRVFSAGAAFDPAESEMALTIAANDLQRDLLLPALFAAAASRLRRVSLRVIPSESPSPSLLRENRCDLLITPLPPAGADIVQKRLLQDRYVCFYDATARPAPTSRAAYLHARHVTVVYSGNERLDFDRRVAAHGIERDIAVSVPNFAGVPAFLRGSTMLASLPSLLGRTLMGEFARVRVPHGIDESAGLARLPMYMVWHQRHQADPAHKWLRARLEQVCRALRHGPAAADGSG